MLAEAKKAGVTIKQILRIGEEKARNVCARLL
jgi:hypothetical protein